MYILILAILFILVLLGILPFLAYSYSEKIKNGRTVKVRSDGKICSSPLGSLPIIPRKICEGNILCYSPPSAPELNFSISKVPKYYRSVCLSLCTRVTINGYCEEENALFDECITLLEPPEGCVNTARPLGRLEGTSDLYYASGVLP